ncbi:hypothetical protein [Mesoplasma coleopterae]|uniref:hypothetical protein n=1 Tax=Mesoplasma coleopterae TaxID=324078 RepID=UPI000D035741|nr:hypothetical protein [Mesoplasma coleopterae]AVN63029.1 hypothetical protein CG000_01780 [Mesoplasma coleopterae]
MIKKLTILKQEKIGPKRIFLWKNDDNGFGIFFGKKSENMEIFYSKPLEVEKKNFFYTKNDSFNFVNNEIKTQEYLYGENIEFKFDTFQNLELYTLFFETLFYVLQNDNFSLIDAIEEISDFFSTSDKNINKIKDGFIGEILFIYYLISKKEAKSEKIKKLFESYMQNFSQKHDIEVSEKLKIEIKSTKSEKREFIVKYDQYKVPEDIELYYAFIRYNFTEQKWGKSFKEIANFVFEKVGYNNNNLQKTIVHFLSLFDIGDKYINVDTIETFVINSKKMPKFIFFPEQNDEFIKEIKFKFNVFDFYTKNNLNRDNEIDNLLKEII